MTPWVQLAIVMAVTYTGAIGYQKLAPLPPPRYGR